MILRICASRHIFCLVLALVASTQAKGLVDLQQDTTSSADTVWRDPGRTKDVRDSTIPVAYVKRQYDHKQQVIVGGVVMLCVALALVGMNNYNPRR